jgi:hypothetical protein
VEAATNPGSTVVKLAVLHPKRQGITAAEALDTAQPPSVWLAWGLRISRRQRSVEKTVNRDYNDETKQNARGN